MDQHSWDFDSAIPWRTRPPSTLVMSCHLMTPFKLFGAEFYVPDLYRCSLPRRISMPTAAAGEFADKRATICPNASFRALP
jgi:hypothetical protein